MSESESGLFAVTVNNMVSILSKSYISLIENGTPYSAFPAVMLWGPPGVGKSQGVREIANTIGLKTGKNVVVTDVRLLLFNPVDLRGIPTSDKEKAAAVWLRPKIFDMDERDEIVNVLFLDEISAAPPSVQAAAYQITLERKIGEHKLPDNCIVIAAGNRVTDSSVAFNMPKALSNRLCHIEIKGDPSSWHDWAVKNSIHPYVVGYIEYNSVALMRFDPTSASYAYPTPRSWEMVSNILTNVSENIKEVYPLIVGCIGSNTAYNFKTWVELYSSMPDISEIFDGKCTSYPSSPELLIALRSVMVRYARVNPEKKLIDNSVEYACSLPWTFRTGLLHDYYYLNEVRPIIKQNEVFKSAVKDGLK